MDERQLRELIAEVKAGRISRRGFIHTMVGLGLTAPLAAQMLAYSGVAHIGYMLVGFAAVSDTGAAMMLFYLVAYLFGNMGAFLVVEAVAQAEGSENIAAYRGLAQRSPVLALCMLLFLLSLGGIPFVVGFWAKLYVFWAAAQQGLYWLVLNEPSPTA